MKRVCEIVGDGAPPRQSTIQTRNSEISPAEHDPPAMSLQNSLLQVAPTGSNDPNSVPSSAPSNRFVLLDDDAKSGRKGPGVESELVSPPAVKAGVGLGKETAANLDADETELKGFTKVTYSKGSIKKVATRELKELVYDPDDADFDIDLPLLMGVKSSEVHHSTAKTAIDGFLTHVFKTHPEVLELMESLKSDKRREQMRFKLAGCSMLLIIKACPPGRDQSPSVVITVYKAICRGLFEVLASVFDVDTGAILGLLRSRARDKEKVANLCKYFHVKRDDRGSKDIMLLFRRLASCHRDKREAINNWIITVLYVEHMAPVFDAKYPGAIYASKYYKLYKQGAPHMSMKDAKAVNVLLDHLGRYMRNVSKERFDPARILKGFGVPPAIAVKVALTTLEYASEKDAAMNYQGKPNRKEKWAYGLERFRKIFKDPKFLMSLLTQDAKVSNGLASASHAQKSPSPPKASRERSAPTPVHQLTKRWSEVTGLKVNEGLRDTLMSILEIQEEQKLQKRIEDAISPSKQEEHIEKEEEEELDPEVLALLESVMESEFPNTSMSHAFFLASQYPGFPGLEILQKVSRMVNLSNMLETSPLESLTEEEIKTLMESPCRDIFRKIQSGDRVKISITHQRLLIACILGDFAEKISKSDTWGSMGGQHEHKQASLAERLSRTPHFCDDPRSSGVVCPRGDMCLIFGYIHDGLQRLSETCYDPKHTHMVRSLARAWSDLAHYFSIIGGSTDEKRRNKRERREKRKPPPCPRVCVPAYFIPPELWERLYTDWGRVYNDDDFNSVGLNPNGQENSPLLQLWYLHVRVGTKMLNRFKNRVKNKGSCDNCKKAKRRGCFMCTDFAKFQFIIEENGHDELHGDIKYNENTWWQFGVYLSWFKHLLSVGRDRKVQVGGYSTEADPLSVKFAGEMEPYFSIVRWAVARRTLLPIFTYYDKTAKKYVSHGSVLTRTQISDIKQYMDWSCEMIEYTDGEYRVLSYDRKIRCERYNSRRLRDKSGDDKKLEYVPKLPGEKSDAQLAHDLCLKTNVIPLLLNLAHHQHVLNVMKNNNRVGHTVSVDGEWFCVTCKLEFYSEQELILHMFSNVHLKNFLALYEANPDAYVEHKEFQTAEIARLKEQKSRKKHGTLLSELISPEVMDKLERGEEKELVEVDDDGNVSEPEPEVRLPVEMFEDLYAKFGPRTIPLHIWLYDSVRNLLCKLLSLAPDSSYDAIECRHAKLVKLEKDLTAKEAEVKKNVKLAAKALEDAKKELETKQKEKTNNGHYKRRTHGARHSRDCVKVENKDKTFEPFEKKISKCDKTHRMLERLHKRTESSLESARSRLGLYDEMGAFWDILYSIEDELKKDCPDVKPVNVCQLCPKGKEGFPNTSIPETLREVMIPYYSGHPNIDGGEMPTVACGSCYNQAIKHVVGNSRYVVSKVVRSALTIVVHSMKAGPGRVCDEHTARIRLYDTLFAYGQPSKHQCQHCQLVPGNHKGITIPGSVIAESVRAILSRFLMTIPYDGIPNGINDEEIDIGRHLANALPTIVCRVCLGRLVESVAVRLIKHGAGKPGVIDIALLKKLYGMCSPSDRKAITRPIRLPKDLANSCLSTERVCTKIADYIGSEHLLAFISPDTVDCKTVADMDALSHKYFKSISPTDRFQYESDIRIVGILVQNTSPGSRDRVFKKMAEKTNDLALKDHIEGLIGKSRSEALSYHLRHVRQVQSRRRRSPTRGRSNSRNSSTSSRGGRGRAPRSNPNSKWDGKNALARKIQEEKRRERLRVIEFQRIENEKYQAELAKKALEKKESEGIAELEIESKKQKNNQTLTLTTTIPTPMQDDSVEFKSVPITPDSLIAAHGGHVEPDEITTAADSEMAVRMHMMEAALQSRMTTHKAEQQYNSIVLSKEFKIGQDATAWLQKLDKGGLDPLVKLVEDYVGPINTPNGPARTLAAINQLCSLLTADVMRQRDEMEALHANIYLKHQNPLINPSKPKLPEKKEEPEQAPAPQQHVTQHSILLGHVFPAPGFLLTDGPDFIVREMSDFKVPGHMMLLFLTTGKPIKTNGIHFVWVGPSIYIDTVGNGVATYRIAGHAIRDLATITYPDLAVRCEHDSQKWCYMKNGGRLCIRVHKHQDGEGLVF